MYTVCYVLIDDDSLRYYRQLLISLTSLRRRGFPGEVKILTDETTAKIIGTRKGAELSDLSAEPVVVDVPEKLARKARSRFIKTSIREHIEGDFLFIDTDTVIADALPDQISAHDIAMVLDGHLPMAERTNIGGVDFAKDIFRKCGYPFDISARVFNSGVIWCRDTDFSHDFFRRWHDEWTYTNGRGVVRDQPSLCRVSAQAGDAVAELDGRFNVQVSWPVPVDFLVNAVIIHYYNDFNHDESAYVLQQPETQELDIDSETIRQVIESPKTAFVPCRLVKLNGPGDRMAQTETYRFLLSSFNRRKGLFRFLESSVRTAKKVKNRIVGRKK